MYFESSGDRKVEDEQVAGQSIRYAFCFYLF